MAIRDELKSDGWMAGWLDVETLEMAGIMGVGRD